MVTSLKLQVPYWIPFCGVTSSFNLPGMYWSEMRVTFVQIIQALGLNFYFYTWSCSCRLWITNQAGCKRCHRLASLMVKCIKISFQVTRCPLGPSLAGLFSAIRASPHNRLALISVFCNQSLRHRLYLELVASLPLGLGSPSRDSRVQSFLYQISRYFLPLAFPVHHEACIAWKMLTKSTSSEAPWSPWLSTILLCTCHLS